MYRLYIWIACCDNARVSQLLLVVSCADVEFVVQNVTVQSVACATLVNVGSQLAASNHPGLASVLFGGSSVFGFLIYKGFKRVRRIDKFEKNIRG